MHPAHHKMSHKHTEKGVSLLRRSGYKIGGHIRKSSDEAEDKKLIKKAIDEHDNQLHGGKKTHLKLKDGGAASETMPKVRLDKQARGGKAKSTKHQPNINIAVMQPAKKQPVPVPVPVPVRGGAGAPPPPGATGPAAAGPSAMPPRPMPGGAMSPGAGMMKRGGRTKKRADGGSVEDTLMGKKNAIDQKNSMPMSSNDDDDGTMGYEDGEPHQVMGKKHGGGVRRKKRADGGPADDDNDPVDFSGQDMDDIDQRVRNLRSDKDSVMADTDMKGHAYGAVASVKDSEKRGTPEGKARYSKSQRTRDIYDTFKDHYDKEPGDKRGGSVKGKKHGGSVHMTAGSLSGEGRLEKIKAYDLGKRAKR